MTEVAAGQLAEGTARLHRQGRRGRLCWRRHRQHAGDPSADSARRCRSRRRRRPPRLRRSRPPHCAPRRSADSQTAAMRGGLRQALTPAGVPHEGYIYLKAQHGFHNDTTPSTTRPRRSSRGAEAIAWFNKAFTLIGSRSRPGAGGDRQPRAPFSSSRPSCRSMYSGFAVDHDVGAFGAEQLAIGKNSR